MKFSIIIPVYNVGAYLQECIESVLHQSYNDYEIILVDDGSVDGSAKICDSYSNNYSNVRAIHQINAGASCARNAGLLVAEGEYVCFLDGDDYWLNDSFLEHLATKTVGGTDIIFYGIQKFYESDDSWDFPMIPHFEDSNDLCTVVLEQLKEGSFSISGTTKAVRRDYLNSNSIVFQPGIIGEDADWHFKLFTHNPSVDCLNMAVIAYRQRESSTVHVVNPKGFFDNLWVLEHWLTRIESNNDLQGEKVVLLSMCSFLYANLLIIFSWQERETKTKFLKRVKSLKWLLRYAISKRARIIRLFVNSVGVRMTISLLSIISRIKKRQ